MNVNKFIKSIIDINSLVESLTYTDVESNIEDISKKIDDLEDRMDKYSNIKNIPYKEITIDFKEKITLTVRSAYEQTENIFQGRQTFDIVGFSDDFFILTKSEWNPKIALKLTYQKLKTYLAQSGDIKLFFNKYGELSSGVSTRSSIEEKINYEIIKLVER